VAARSISHSHRVTNRMQYPNIQNVFIVENGERRKAKVCTKCLKAGKVVRG
jgi:large subunit ribosomal protein L28